MHAVSHFQTCLASVAALAFVSMGAACESQTSSPKPHPAESQANVPAPPAKEAEIDWLHNDYPGALKRAKAKGLPIVIDMWAPWCHTCLSMKHTVLKDPGLRPLADQFVFLAIDTDRPTSASVLEKFPIRFWPTFFVVSPDGAVQARAVGGMSVAQFRSFLEEGQRNHLAGAELAENSPLAWVRTGDRATLTADWINASQAYGKALHIAPADWSRRSAILVSQISALYFGESWEDCVALGLKEYRATGSSAGAADFLSLARACTTHLPKDDSRRLQLASIAATRLQSIVDDPEAPLSMDDRGEAMRILRNFHLDGQDDKAARAIAERQRILLDQAARDASSPMMAMTYNWPRAEVYAFLDRAKELVPVFERSEKDLPNQYDPPYRLAWIYHKIGQHDLALAAAKRALEKAYGPRKGRVLSLIAAVHREREDLEAEIAARRAVVALYEGLPPGHEHAGRLEKARKTLQELVGE